MNGSKDLLLIRADASVAIGTGHIMRCLSLAQGWRRAGGGSLFALAESTPGLEERLRTDGFEFVRLNVPAGGAEDVAQTIALAGARNAAWVVADGYHFGADYQRGIKSAGLRLLLFDDNGHAGHYSADLVLNQNFHATPELYRNREPHTRLLLGTTYALLRPQFDAWRSWKREIPPVARKILVTLGGTDPDNVTSKVIDALGRLDVEAKIVVGGSNPHRADLESKIHNPKSNLSLVVDATNMPELMAWADIAVSAGGTTAWELAFMGLPSLVLVLAANQRAVAKALEKAVVARKTAPPRVAADLAALVADGDARRVMSEMGRRLMDNDGAGRVVACLRSVALALRRVREEDCRLIWEWANDPEARAVSLSSGEIPWESHQQWFAARVHSPACLFYVAANGNGTPVGQIRYDVEGAEAVISVSLATEARGRGCGAALILRGSEQCFTDSAVELIRAYIKPENAASARAFVRAGYADAGTAEVRDQTVRQFVLRRGGKA